MNLVTGHDLTTIRRYRYDCPRSGDGLINDCIHVRTVGAVSYWTTAALRMTTIRFRGPAAVLCQMAQDVELTSFTNATTQVLSPGEFWDIRCDDENGGDDWYNYTISGVAPSSADPGDVIAVEMTDNGQLFADDVTHQVKAQAAQ